MVFYDLAEEEKSGDEDSDKTSVNKDITEPSKQLKRTVMHCMHNNALTTHSCFFFFELNNQLGARRFGQLFFCKKMLFEFPQ